MMKVVLNQIQRGNFSEVTPEFGRVGDIQRMFGVKKGILYRWINEKRVKSICLRERGNLKGIRLISVDSVRSYIQSQMDDEVTLSA